MHDHPTSYADVNALLAQLLSAMQTILAEKLVGLYLYGSLVTGDFDHECSDIDLLAATSSTLTDAELDTLRTMHENFAATHQQWDDRIEVAYLSVTALKTYRTQKSPIAVISPGEPFHTKEAGRDWLLNWYVVREKGTTLFGPAPAMLIDPITHEEFLQSVREYMQTWRERVEQVGSRKEQAYAILTMCRAYDTLNTGKYDSKKQAALWTQKALPEWTSLINSALAWRAAMHDENVDHNATLAETRRFVQHMVDLCEQIPL